MVSYDNSGKKIGEINIIIRPGEGVITTNAVYSGDRVITQTISTRDKHMPPDPASSGKKDSSLSEEIDERGFTSHQSSSELGRASILTGHEKFSTFYYPSRNLLFSSSDLRDTVSWR